MNKDVIKELVELSKKLPDTQPQLDEKIAEIKKYISNNGVVGFFNLIKQ